MIPARPGAVDAAFDPTRADDSRIGLDVPSLQRAFIDNLFFTRAKFPEVATRNDYYLALAYTVRDRLLQRWVTTARAYLEHESRTVVYLSAEYLLGPHLGNNLVNLGILDETREALGELGLDLDALLEQEEEPGLGNGGLGRLAACYMESLASLRIPTIGYGIRYEFGIFDQALRDGWQVEVTDKWLRFGNPWEISNPEILHEVKLGGRTEPWVDDQGRYRVRWIPARALRGMGYDTPILGYGVDNVNLLRLWKAQATEAFDLEAFNHGDYYGAVADKVASENVSKVLYPNDEPAAGKELRLEQQYFFVSCSLQDLIRIYRMRSQDLTRLHEKFVIQLNDTHPALAVPELMRLLVDEHGLGWEQAWTVTEGACCYTNHTLLPEALEKWPLDLFGRLLPRHLEIVFEINRRFLERVRREHPGDEGLAARLSLIDESGPRYVRMAHLAAVGSHRINGVARLHTELLKREVLCDFDRLSPGKIVNVTNGVTPRRFLLLSNPGLSHLIRSHAGEGWVRDLERLRALEPLAEDAGFQEDWRRVKRDNKQRLARLVRERTGLAMDPDSLLDVQAKRIHEYKRQHLAVLQIVAHYRALKDGQRRDAPPRTYLFAGKAAPGYRFAKLMIKLVTSVAGAIDRDPAVRDRLRVVFFPDFNVKNAQAIYPAADLSEQISLAGKEASGTGNMKFALNGALTIGTLDGANVEIREAVGPENFFLFGLTADEVRDRKARGYDPRAVQAADPELRASLDLLRDGTFSQGDRGLFAPLLANLLDQDPYLVLADHAAYADAQRRVDAAYADVRGWTRSSILNTARCGRFSSDRSIRDYCRDVWSISPVPISAPTSRGAAGVPLASSAPPRGSRAAP